ncbi:MAG: MFS transporter [Bdellovibrio sp.]
MIGAGESFFAAYALSKGLGEVVAGLVIGLPMMMGAILQTGTPYFFSKWPRPKRWVLLVGTLQALILFALMTTTLSINSGPVGIFVLIGCYWACSFSGGAVWNYWMGFIVEPEHRPKFFSYRGQITQYGTIAGLLLAGVMLHSMEKTGIGPRAYAMPFLIAFLARCLSVYLLGRQMAIDYQEQLTTNAAAMGSGRQNPFVLMRGVTFLQEAWRVFNDNVQVRRDLTFMFLFNCAIFVSSSFVTPFLLVKLKFDYLSFMAAQMALFFGKILALILAKHWIDKFGVRRVLFVGALGMSPLPALWFFVQNTSTAVVLQAFSGFFWGLFEVAWGLVLFSELPGRDKIQLLTWNSFFQTSAILIGTIIGGQLLSSYDETVFGYYLIFVAGAVLRTLFVLAHRPKSAINSR